MICAKNLTNAYYTKAWGDEKDPIILALHGWTDNANSFDPIIPHLPNNYYYLCIEWPSHGKSSDLQASIFIQHCDFLVALKLVYDHLKRNKVILMAHSMGGFVAIHFAQYYPQCVSKLIIFDVFFYYPVAPKEFYRQFEKEVNLYATSVKKHRKTGPPKYTKDEAIKRLIAGRMTTISVKAATILAERGLIETEPGQFQFRVPQHVKQLLPLSRTLDTNLELVKQFPIRCPHLIVLSSNSSFMKMVNKDILKEYEKNQDFEFHIVKGNHEVHLEHPERVAPLVTDFLCKYSSKL